LRHDFDQVFEKPFEKTNQGEKVRLQNQPVLDSKFSEVHCERLLVNVVVFYVDYHTAVAGHLNNLFICI
jgi:hypothetical protein